ncbi:hypothetical protein O6H91_10G027800 [Diphasiastrum complanatum]|uniref:Uncharacterized protein n=1 Tax=Diphasiastrum complanatum TaxID=34168 RepID=A0ACC2CFJ7_DIPCM|nr:hypothetical protein O6H91_10G027800 [Diphasiastrum complanatum]
MMGKQKKHQHQPRRQRSYDDDPLPSSAFDAPSLIASSIEQAQSDEEEALDELLDLSKDAGDYNLRHTLYQRSVQSPKGDISYLQKFFLTYVGGRIPLHLYEDFCGTALICAEWVRGDARRTALGIDLDEETLIWGLQHNIGKLGIDAHSRSRLLCGDVLHPLSKARVIKFEESKVPCTWSSAVDCQVTSSHEDLNQEESTTGKSSKTVGQTCSCSEKESEVRSPNNDVVAESVWPEGGIFVLDIYGGTSSECAMKLRRRYEEFMYIWEQEDFDVVTRTTRISLHFQLNKSHRMLRHAFTYRWRLWTLPEVRDCLEEAGFSFVHIWIREMSEAKDGDEVEATSSVKFEEVGSFLQQHSWNAYVVAVKCRTSE